MSSASLRKLARRIIDSDEVLLHTGTGLLAETDLPVAALSEAVWGDPEGRFTIDTFESEPETVWAAWVDFWEDVDVDPGAVSPQPVHERVVELVESGHVSTVISENVFGLLREAGLPPEDCIEFHGRVDRARCVNCGHSKEVAPTDLTGNQRCWTCGRTFAPGIVLAEEPPARSDRLLAWSRAESCDLYLAVGTQLTVYPTAENVERALETGTDLVVVTPDPTAFDDEATTRLSMDPARALARLRDALEILG